MKQKITKTSRGRPSRNNQNQSKYIESFKEKTQYQCLLTSLLMNYVYAILNEDGKNERQPKIIDDEVRLNSFNWLTSLPKIFYSGSQQFENQLGKENPNFNFFQKKNLGILRKNPNLLKFLKSVACVELKSVINQIRNVAINFIIASYFHQNAEECLQNLRRFYFQDLQIKKLNEQFRYSRFQVQYISLQCRKIIQKNLKEFWKGYILLLTKIFYLVITNKSPESHLIKLYNCNQDKTDVDIFREIIRVEQNQYCQWTDSKYQKYQFNRYEEKKDEAQIPTGLSQNEKQDKNLLQNQKIENQFYKNKIYQRQKAQELIKNEYDENGFDVNFLLQQDSQDQQQDRKFYQKKKNKPIKKH